MFGQEKIVGLSYLFLSFVIMLFWLKYMKNTQLYIGSWKGRVFRVRVNSLFR